MKTRLLVLTSIFALAFGVAACGDDDSSGGSGGSSGSGASGGSTNGGSSNGGSGGSAGSGATGGTAGSGGTAGGAAACGPASGDPVDACKDLEAEYTASYDVGGEMQTIGTIAANCARNMCISQLGSPGFTPCVQDCIDAATGDAIAANDCSACVVITVECGSTACISKCLSDKDECGPNGDKSCCDACLCENGAYDALTSCTGLANDTCADFE